MSFEKLTTAKVRHRDLGYIVQIAGRFAAEYLEGGRRATIDVEFGGPSVLIYAASLKWDEDGEPPVEGERAEEIVDRICRGFEAMGDYPRLVRS